MRAATHTRTASVVDHPFAARDSSFQRRLDPADVKCTDRSRSNEHRDSLRWSAVADRGVARARRAVLAAAARTFLLSCLISIPVVLLWLDIRWLRNSIGEFSATEFGQLVLLVFTVLAFVYLGWRCRAERRFAVLAAGFFTCMLIRESDAVLDLLLDGLWQVMVTAVAVSCLAYSLLDWRSALRSMARLVASRSGVVMMIGLALLLAYSRLLGMGGLWKGLLEDQYVRVFKNAVEEGSELLGYMLILVASVGFVTARLRRLARRRRTSPRESGQVTYLNRGQPAVPAHRRARP